MDFNEPGYDFDPTAGVKKDTLRSLKLSDSRPDLPLVSFHQLLTWDRCKYAWYLKYVHKFEKFEKSYAMELGTMGHAMLFDWYKTGIDHSEDFANRWLADLDKLSPEQVSNINVALQQFKLYREIWSPREDRGYTTEMLEYHFEVIMTTPRGRQFILQGYIDRGSRDSQGRLWLEDYKWRGRMATPVQLLMEAQLTYYAGAMIMLGFDVYGLMITQINTYPYTEKSRQKKQIDDLFKREKFARSQDEIDNVMTEVGHMMDEMFDAQETGLYRRSLRPDCDKCDYQQPCAMGIKGFDAPTYMLTSPAYYKRAKAKITQKGGGIPELQRPRVRISDDYIVDIDDQTITLE